MQLQRQSGVDRRTLTVRLHWVVAAAGGGVHTEVVPMTRTRAATLAFSIACSLALITTAQAQAGGVQKLNHVVVIYQENWSFDSLYGKFPGANGIDNAAATT